MPESPDFDAIARRLIAHLPIPQGAEVAVHDGGASDEVAASIAEQLRLVWNARGAADLAQLERDDLDGETFTDVLVSALRSLDR